MSLAFSEISNLLQRLEDVELNDPPLLRADKDARTKDVVAKWFKSHRRAINALDVQHGTALLSALLPERRTDRVYGVQAPRLSRILSRCMGLGVTRAKDLELYKTPGHGDLASCLERVIKAGGSLGSASVTLGEVDELLDLLAGGCRWSHRSFREKLPPGSSEQRDRELARLFNCVSSLEGKWLVRLIMKDFSPVCVDERLVLRHFHFLLPDLLRFQNNLGSAVGLLKTDFAGYHEDPDPRSERLFRNQASEKLRPAIGVKVGRPNCFKARSIGHCMTMTGAQEWVVERKYDGEYCEIHVDLTRSPDPSKCIQIFSKSGKDSTLDKKDIHQTLIDCLRLGRKDCKIERQAILVGELVVFSDTQNCISPFDRLRAHVPRSGHFLGTAHDLQKRDGEHLAIVFCDLLLLDEEIVMNRPIEERRVWLREVYQKTHGRAMSSEWKVVRFADAKRAEGLLVQQFAASIAERCEGLVLKPCGTPYFSLDYIPGEYKHCFIKLKKDYITGMGDEADLAVVGASHNAQQVLRAGIKDVKWTDFHLACCINKEHVIRFGVRPIMKTVRTIQAQACIPKPILQALNGIASRSTRSSKMAGQPCNFDLDMRHTKMNVIFDRPPVLEVLGSGFEKPSDCDFFMLRHVRVTKLHEDRHWSDCVSFQELQQQAREARESPADSNSKETQRWIEKLVRKAKRKSERRQSCTPSTRATTTPSTAQTRRSTVYTACQSSPLAERCVNLLPTPHATSQIQSPPSSALSNTVSVKQSGHSSKRSRDDTRETFITPKRQRTIENTAADSVEYAQSPLGVIVNKIVTQAPLLRSPSSPAQVVCSSSLCLFGEAVVCLGVSIQTAAVVVDLLRKHNVVQVPSAVHWDRDSFAYQERTDVVSESQAFPGLRKILLVEQNRRQWVIDTAQQIIGLNNGQFRERIEMYDWRVLECCSEHDLGAEAVKKHFIGATIMNEGLERATFVSRLPWLSNSLVA